MTDLSPTLILALTFVVGLLLGLAIKKGVVALILGLVAIFLDLIPLFATQKMSRKAMHIFSMIFKVLVFPWNCNKETKFYVFKSGITFHMQFHPFHKPINKPTANRTIVQNSGFPDKIQP